MKLAASPDGLVKHYVPEDKGAVFSFALVSEFQVIISPPGNRHLPLPLHLPRSYDAGKTDCRVNRDCPATRPFLPSSYEITDASFNLPNLSFSYSGNQWSNLGPKLKSLQMG